MVKNVKNNYHLKILNELEKAKINKELIDNVYAISKKQIETLKNTIIKDKIPDTVQEVFTDFLEKNKNDKF
tara:strand:+ start:399 stop:611 length:213 start_codon:yes stop_codon:yes gene_type:complete